MFLIAKDNVRNACSAQNSPGENTGSASLRIPAGAGTSARAVCSLSALAVCTKACGFAEKVVIANFCGTADTADVYFASVGVVLSVVWLVRELVYPSLLPVFADSLSRSAGVSGCLFRRTFLWAAGFVALAAAIMACFSNTAAAALVPGFSPHKQQATADLLRLLTPAVLFLGLTMVTYTVLNARRRFIAAAWPEAALKLFIVAGLVILLPVLGVNALALVLGAGSLGCLLVQLLSIPESRFMFRIMPAGSGNDSFSRVLALMGPLAVGVVFSHVGGLVDNIFASILPAGQLSYLGYSKKLTDAILLIGPVALVTVVYSELSHLACAGDYEKFSLLAARSFRLLVYVSVPAACILFGLREPLIKLLFQRGRFDEISALGTSRTFAIYACGLVTFSLEPLLVQCFFALSDTKTPVKLGIVCVFLDIGLAALLLQRFECLGIAAAMVASKTLKTAALAVLLNRRIKGLFDSSIWIFLGKLGCACCVMLAALTLLSAVGKSGSFLGTALWGLVLPGAAAVATFAACSYLLRMDELKTVLSVLRFGKGALRALSG